ncbi:MAG: hypothetical protein ABL876_18185 [Chitinophagaceae bacterium]
MPAAFLSLYLARAVYGILCALALFFSIPSVSLAGFGITPPYVINDRLTRGIEYEQKITIVRSDPIQDLNAEITFNIPEVEGWFSIDKGIKFVLPKGETQVPMVIKVRVPEDAAYAQHKGAIRIRTSSSDVPKGGGVSIALGAQIDVDIKVVDQILDFDVRKTRLADLEEGRRKWGLFFPAKIRFFMTIENTGNAEYGPTKVQFDIYDRDMETLLETVESTNDIEKIAPFEIKEVLAEIPTRLPAGRYKAKYTVYKGEEVAQQNEVLLSVAALGSVPGYAGYGLWGISMQDKAKVGAVLGIPFILLIVLILIVASKRKRRRRRKKDSHVS